MRIDDRFRPVQIAPGHVQIGTGPQAVRLETEVPGVPTLLEELTDAQGWTGSLDALARRCGISGPALRSLLRRLTPVLDPHASGDASEAPGCPPDGGPRMPEQAQVLGLGRTGAAIVLALTEAGVQRLALGDDSPVGLEDLGTGFAARDVGHPRAAALARRVDELQQRALCLPCPMPRESGHGPGSAERALGPWLGEVTVVVTRGAWDPGLLARAGAAGQPTLPVVLDSTGADVGPWCAPGAPGCPLCLESEQERDDPLRARRLRALRHAGAGREPIATAQSVAGLVTQLLHRGPSATGGLRWRLDDTTDGPALRRAPVSARPGCVCAVPTDVWLDDAQAEALLGAV